MTAKRLLTLSLSVLLWFLPLAGRADDGVLFSYVLEERLAANDVTTSEFGFLIHFDKAASADIGGTAKLDVVAHDEGDSVRVDLRLNDYVGEDVRLVGTTAVTIPYGATHTITWEPPSLGTYTLYVSPQRHTFE